VVKNLINEASYSNDYILKIGAKILNYSNLDDLSDIKRALNKLTFPDCLDKEIQEENLDFVLLNLLRIIPELDEVERKLFEEEYKKLFQIDMPVNTEATDMLPVLVIGAGAGGIAASIKLSKMGLPFKLVEKGSDFGGCWNSAAYPGARVDVANALYSFASHYKKAWKNIYATQLEMKQYLSELAEKYKIQKHTKFNTLVLSCTQKKTKEWVCRFVTDGKEWDAIFSGVIFATGQLSQPKTPKINGLNKFRGTVRHSGDWKNIGPIENKHVAVIGSAASGVQISCEIADKVKRLSIYGRSDNWFYEVPHYRNKMDSNLYWAQKNLKDFSKLFRLAAFLDTNFGNIQGVSCDENGIPTEQAVTFKERLTKTLIKTGLGKNIPAYPPGEKRILVDDGSWAKTLARSNVELIKSPIVNIDEQAIICREKYNKVDVILLATGYVTDTFVGGVKVMSDAGMDLEQFWGARPYAFGGIYLPEFEGLYLVYGPNTNGVVNGNIIWFIEQQIDVICRSINQKRRLGKSDLEETAKANIKKFVEVVNAGNRRRVWSHGFEDSWYKNGQEANVQNWPFSLGAYKLCITNFESFLSLEEINFE
jgi:4-hydroxyacetophenone monooxygenase